MIEPALNVKKNCPLSHHVSLHMMRAYSKQWY